MEAVRTERVDVRVPLTDAWKSVVREVEQECGVRLTWTVENGYFWEEEEQHGHNTYWVNEKKKKTNKCAVDVLNALKLSCFRMRWPAILLLI